MYKKQGIARSEPEKSLLHPLHKTGGRNNTGRITARHRGGGHKHQYRIIDPRRRDKGGVPAKATYIEYGPNRTARTALLCYADDERRYIVVPKNLRQDDFVEDGPNADIGPGSSPPLRNIPVGTMVYCVELHPLGDTKTGRSTGTSVQLVAREGKYAQLRMPSGEIRNVSSRCRASVGEVGDAEQSNVNWGKASRKRWKDIRPTIRGVIMNPVDHPHGGGEGKISDDHRPVSPWDKPEGRTRRPKKVSDKFIVHHRKIGNKR